MNNEYYLVEGEEKKGPYTYQELINMGIDIYTEIFVGSNEESIYASYLPEFSEYFEKLGYVFPTENNIAHPVLRTIAFIIDYMIVSAVVIIVILKLGLITLPVNANFDPAETLKMLSSKNIYIIEGSLITTFFLYNIIFESILHGSVGKLICGLKVVDEDGQRLSLTKTFLRNCGALTIFHLLGMIVLIVSFFYRPVRQTWYERLTKTYVIKLES
jgi:uncharacterized RDD family membrane protein YckC